MNKSYKSKQIIVYTLPIGFSILEKLHKASHSCFELKFKSWDGFRLSFSTLNTELLDARGVAASIGIVKNSKLT